MQQKHIIIATIILLMCGTAAATTYTVCASGCDYTTIQAAVTAASLYDTVYVYNGTYTENVDIATAHLTLEGEGRDVVTVNAASSADHVFDIQQDYVNISGFTVVGGTSTAKAGICISSGEHCDISDNNATGNRRGIFLYSSGSNNTLTSNTANSNTEYGIIVYSPSSNNTLTSNTANSNNKHGIYLYSSNDNNLTNNIANSNYRKGFYLYSSNDNNLTNNIANSNSEVGIFISSSNCNDIINNTANSNSHNGIYVYVSDDNNLTNNIANSNSHYGIYQDSSSGNALANNAISDNLNALSYLQTDSQESTVGTQIDFNFTMKTMNNTDCSTCSYTLSLHPSETNLQYSSVGASVEGNFTPSQRGIYSLRVNVTDVEDNYEVRKYVWLINATATETANYYFREVLATHGQPFSYGTDHDAGSLLFEPPSSEEDVWCGLFVGFPIDDLHVHLFGVFKQINYSIWYKVDEEVFEGNYTGIQRRGISQLYTDYSIPVTVATSKTFNTFSFSVDWTTDYFLEWYFMSIMLVGDAPYIYSNATHPSYANITYNYSATPALKSISNENIQILSATSPASDDTSASIALDGIGSTCLVVQMPNTALTYTATWDGGACTGGDCSFTQSIGELNFTLTLGSEHTIAISEAGAGTNDIVLGANKYGMLRKDVTAAQTFSTIASGFTHDVCFTWWDDVTDTWKSYWVGDSYNSAQSVPEHESCFVLMDGTGETVSCGVAPAETVVIPTGWSSIYLRESANHTLTEIKTDMQVDGTVTNLYAWNHGASGTGAWVSVDVTPSFVVEPNEGLLINNGGAQYNWDGAVP